MKESVQVGKPLMLRQQPIIMASVISLATKTKLRKEDVCPLIETALLGIAFIIHTKHYMETTLVN